jgi:hypothetical protein
MRHVEEAARPSVSRLMLGQPFLLDTFSQRLLATFLCLVSMRIELGGQVPRVIPDSDHRYLMQHREPPSNWHVWIARLVDDHANNYWFGHIPMQYVAAPSEPSLKAVTAGPEYSNTQVTTLIVGKLCAHLFSSTVWTDFPGYEEPKLSSIWPQDHFDIDTRALPRITAKLVPWLHETIAREGNPPEQLG